jgi:hypothetical protein
LRARSRSEDAIRNICVVIVVVLLILVDAIVNIISFISLPDAAY